MKTEEEKIVNTLKKWHFIRKQSHADTGDRWQLLIDLIVKLAENMSKPINQHWFMKAE